MANEKSGPATGPVELTDSDVEQVAGGDPKKTTSTSTSSSTVIFKIDGVNGESTDAKHSDW